MADLTGADLSFLSQIQVDAPMSAIGVAQSVGVTPRISARQIQKLRDEGVITGQVALLDRAKVGLSTLIFAQVRLSPEGRGNISEISETIRAFPEVLECYALIGEYDLILKIVCPDIKYYENFLFDSLNSIPCVQDVHSIVALSEIKMTTALPLHIAHQAAPRIEPVRLRSKDVGGSAASTDERS